MDKIKLRFKSGHVEEFYYNPGWDKLMTKLPMQGVKLWKISPTIVIPFTEGPIEIIELVDYEDTELTNVAPEVKVEPLPPTNAQPVEMDSPPKFGEPPAGLNNDQKIQWMIDKSNCPHERKRYYYTDSLVGKAKKPVRRYFPVCYDCGLRFKFVKESTLTDAEKASAVVWG